MFRMTLIEKNSTPIQWWGYIHKEDRKLKVKRYFGPEDIEEANMSPFCTFVTGPVTARTNEEAGSKLMSLIVDDIL